MQLGDDEVERTAVGVLWRLAKESLRFRVPSPDHAGRVGPRLPQAC